MVLVKDPVDTAPESGAAEIAAENWQKFKDLVQRVRIRLWPKRWWILLAVLIGAGLGVWVAVLTPQTYVAEAQVLLVQSLTPQAQAQELLGAGPRPNQNYAEAILGSRRMAGEVITGLKLDSQFSTYSMQKSFRVGTTRQGILELSFQSTDPELAVKILNEYLRAYRRYTDSTVLTVAKGERVFLEKQVALSNAALKKSQDAVADFEKAHGVEVNLETVRTLASNLFTERIGAASSLRVAEASLDALRKGNVRSLEATRRDPYLQSSLPGTPAGSIQTQLVQARIELAGLRLFNTDNVPQVKALKEKIANLERVQTHQTEASLEATVSNLTPQLIEANAGLVAARTRLEAATQEGKRLDEQLHQLPQDELVRQRLRRTLDIQDTLNRTLQSALQAAQLSEAREPIYLVTLDLPAILPPLVPPQMIMLSFGVLGAVIGAALVILPTTIRALRPLPTLPDPPVEV